MLFCHYGKAAIAIMTCLLGAPLTGVADEPRPIAPTDLETMATADSPVPLPLQAIRIRLKQKNLTAVKLRTQLPVHELALVERLTGSPAGKRPPNFRPVLDNGQSGHGSSFRGPRQEWSESLAPGQGQACTFAVAARWSRDGAHRTAEPLFPTPGTYVLRCWFQSNYDGKRPDIYKDVTVTVPEPQGDDKAAYEVLRADQELVSALLWPMGPVNAPAHPRLRDLVEKYPRSSYADYARLQIAWHEARGAGTWAGPQARAALTLEEMLPRRFAYQPYAWLLFRKADDREVARVGRLFQRYFPDALEWLVAYENRTLSKEEWATLRQSEPKPWRADDPDLQPRTERPTGGMP